MLNVKNINQYYGGSHILRDVSLQAHQGKVTVLLGRNGVGKTTLLKSLMGLVPIKTGTIEFDGKPIQDATPYERARALCHTAFDLGITHFDLANNYGPPPGSAETCFGRILADDLRPYRDELILSTKAGYSTIDAVKAASEFSTLADRFAREVTGS